MSSRGTNLKKYKNVKKGRFCAVAYSRLKNMHETEDAVQNAFLAVAKNPETLFAVSEEKRVAYICVMVRNAANDEILVYILKTIKIYDIIYYIVKPICHCGGNQYE